MSTTQTTTMREFLNEVEAQAVPPQREQAVQILHEARQKLASLMVPIPDDTAELHPLTAGTVTDEWLHAAVRRQQILDQHRAKENILKSFIGEAESRLRTMQADPDVVLHRYGERLQQLLDEAFDTVTALGDARTAQAAIDTGRADEWAHLCNLARDYAELRAAQDRHTTAEVKLRARSMHNPDDHASDTHIANLDDIWPTWRHPGTTPRTVYLDGQPDDPIEPWPSDPVLLLIWLVTSDAEPWCPTTRQLNQLWAERTERQNPNPKPIGERAAGVTPTPAYNGPALLKSFQERQRQNGYGQQAKVITSVPTQGASI